MRLRHLFTALLAPVSLAAAADGKIPIYQVTTITSPGHYIVTRGIQAASGPAITIQADDVTLDLNGRVVRGDAAAAEGVIKVSDGASGVLIRNGTIEGATNGVYQSDTSGTGDLSVHDVRIRVTGNAIFGLLTNGGAHVELLDSVVTVAGAGGVEVTNSKSVRIERSTFSTVPNLTVVARGIVVSAGRAVISSNIVQIECDGTMTGIDVSAATWVVRANQLDGGLCDANAGIRVNGGVGSIIDNVLTVGFRRRAIDLNASGAFVTGNVLWSGGGQDGLQVNGSDNTIADNHVQCGGGPQTLIAVGGDRNRILRNKLSGTNCGPSGIVIGGSFNLIEGNTVSGPGDGIVFFGSSNSYRSNFLRVNDEPIIDNGTGNTDDGGNVF
jgi:hypothetical protein